MKRFFLIIVSCFITASFHAQSCSLPGNGQYIDTRIGGQVKLELFWGSTYVGNLIGTNQAMNYTLGSGAKTVSGLHTYTGDWSHTCSETNYIQNLTTGSIVNGTGNSVSFNPTVGGLYKIYFTTVVSKGPLRCGLASTTVNPEVWMYVCVPCTPPPANAGADIAICAGSSTQLNATGGGTYSWSPTTGLSNPNIANPVASPASTTNYVVTVTNASGCAATDAVLVTVNPLPNTPNPIAASNNSCGPVTLSISGPPNGITYYWQGTSCGTLTNNNASSSFTANSSGTYYVRARNNTTGCWSSACASRTVVVNTVPPNPPAPTGVTPSCGPTTLSVAAAPTGITYYWQGTSCGTLTNNNASSPLSVTSSGTYYVRARNNVSGCWSACTSLAVVVNTVPNNPPNPNAGSNPSCGPTSLTMPNGPPAGVTFYWQGTSCGTSTANPTSSAFTVNTSGTYYVRARNNTSGCWSTGCGSLAVVIGSTPANPPAPIPASNPACGSTTLSMPAPPSEVTYYWQGTSCGTSTANDAANPFTVNATGTYYVRARNNAAGCWSTGCASVFVTIVAPPANPPVPTPGSNPACGSTSLTMPTAPVGAAYYWQGTSCGTSLLQPALNNPYPVTASGTYFVRARDLSTGCWSGGCASISISIKPVPSIESTPSTAICKDQSIVLSALANDAINALQFDGVNDWVNIGNTNGFPNNNNSRTIMAWVKTTMTGVGDVLSYGSNSPNKRIVEFGVSKDSVFVSSRYQRFAIVAPVNDGQWHHIAMSFNGTALSLYMDGNLLGTSASFNINNQSGNAAIGSKKAPSLNSFFAGQMDEVSLWNISLSQAQIQAYKNSFIVPPLNTLVGYWRMNELTGNTTFDEGNVPSNNNGLLTNGVTRVIPSTAPIDNLTYAWSPAGSLNTSTGTTVTATPAVTTIYTVTALSPSGCSVSSLITISVNPLPVIAINSNSTILLGGSVSLTASGANTYVWLPVDGLNTNIGATVEASPVITTIYTVSGTDINSCVGTGTVSVTVIQPCDVVPSDQNNIIQLIKPKDFACALNNDSLKWKYTSIPALDPPQTENQYTVHFDLAPEIIDPSTGQLVPDWLNTVGYVQTFASLSAGNYFEKIADFIPSPPATNKTYYWRVGIQYLPISGGVQPITWSADGKFVLMPNPAIAPSESYLLSGTHTDSINWVYGVSYLTEGKTSEGTAYIDGLGKSRQVQSRINTDNTIMGVEAAYSTEGGGVSLTLPAPTQNGEFGYAHRFFDVKTPGGVRDFKTDDFDREVLSALGGINTLASPSKTDTTAGVGLYYGALGPDVYVDDARGYPFSYNVPQKSPVSRPMLTAGGVGETFKITGGNEYEHHYGKPDSPEELIRVFGKNKAPSIENISRTITFDPNGVGYVSYKDNEGKVIATALTVCNAPSLDSLDEDGKAGFTVHVDPLGNNNLDATSLQNGASSKFFIACTDVPVNINYNLKLSSFTIEGLPCQDCKYDVRISIKNEATGQIILDSSRALIPSTNVCSGSPETVAILALSDTLDGPANYIINRSIKPYVDPLTGENIISSTLEQYISSLNTHTDSLKSEFKKLYYADSSFYVLRQTKSSINAPAYIAPQNCFDAGNFSGTGVACNTGGYVNVAEYYNPRAIARDTKGNYYIADAGNHLIRKILQPGMVIALAGTCNDPGLADGTGASAKFSEPYDLVYAADPLFPDFGNIYVADRMNNSIRKITPDGVVTTLVGPLAGLSLPEGITADNKGFIYIASTGNNKIFRCDLSGNLVQIAASATFNQPSDVTVDIAGNLYVTEKGTHSIKRIRTNGTVITLAGTGSPGFGDGVGTAASFNTPVAIGVDKDTNLYVSDAGNNSIRRITSNGTVTTIAGNGAAGYANGQGAAAQFNNPGGLLTDLIGNSFVADVSNNRIRRIVKTRCATEINPCSSAEASAQAGCKDYLWYNDQVAVKTINEPGYTKHLVDLDGDADTSGVPGDENYKLSDISFVSSLNSLDPIWTNFVNAYFRMNWVMPNIVTMEKYAVGSGSELDQNNIKVINDNKTLITTDAQQYYLLKVKIQKDTCHCTVQNFALPCDNQCNQQDSAYIADMDDAYDKLGTSTTLYVQFPGPFGFSLTLKQMVDSYYPLNDEQTGPLTEDDIKLYLDYAAKRHAHESFDKNKCLSRCNGTPPTLCELCKDLYPSCVFDNVDKLMQGYTYFTGKWDEAGIFPYNSTNDLKPNGVVDADEFENLGENLFNFIYSNFSHPDIQNRSKWDELGSPSTGSGCATCAAPPVVDPPCTQGPLKDISAKLPKLFLQPLGTYPVSLLDKANEQCAVEYIQCFKVNGDTATQKQYLCVQDRMNCLKSLDPSDPTYNADSLYCESLYSSCLNNSYNGAISQQKELKIREVLNIIYPNPKDIALVDTLTKQLLIQTAAKTLIELEDFLFYYQTEQQCLVECNNAFNKAFKQWLDEKILTAEKAIKSNFMQQCFGNMNEQFDISYKQSFYHYTLFNYDFGNNLASTVPPEGIDYIDVDNANQNKRNRPTEHRMKTEYQTNSLYTLAMTSPDEGTTRYLYDKAGRIRFSQTAEQKQRGIDSGYTVLSYRKYDSEERLIESGEYRDNTHEICYWSNDDCPTQFGCLCNLNTYSVQSKLGDILWPQNVNNTFDETYVMYDVPSITYNVLGSGYNQKYLEGRVSKMYNANNTIHFSYDVNGRTKFVVQEIAALANQPSPPVGGGAGGGFKTIDYLYENLTSRINQVIYQKENLQERIVQRYSYDLDDRVNKVEVSRDAGNNWLPLTDYQYYLHGPVKHMSYGNKIQDVDYVYNINGWLKAINNPISTGAFANETGEGGTSVSNFAKDIFAEALNYYKGDYGKTSVGLDQNSATVPTVSSYLGNANTNVGKDLFNGNIASTIAYNAYELTSSDTTPNLLVQGYRYDFLNRLKHVYTETGNRSTFAFANAADPTDPYGVHMNYDANGNIQALLRNTLNRTFTHSGGLASGTEMDNMQYKYAQNTIDHYGKAKKLNNKLAHVRDFALHEIGLGDIIDNGSGYDSLNTNTSNYKYDAKGRIITDLASDIEKIEYNVYDKVTKVTHTAASDKPTIEYTYDARQQRLTKKVSTPTDTTTNFYVYDAAGTLMATYEKQSSTNNYKLLEQELYGLAMVGNYKADEILTNNPQPSTNNPSQLRLALTDHLGSIRAVVTGVKDVNNNPDIVTLTDISDFGWTMQSRNFVGEEYRYSYQGSEKDEELFAGSSYATYFRMMDSRIGRWMTVDKIIQPWNSAYMTMENNPAMNVDNNGAFVIKGSKRKRERLNQIVERAWQLLNESPEVRAQFFRATGYDNLEKVKEDLFTSGKGPTLRIKGSQSGGAAETYNGTITFNNEFKNGSDMTIFYGAFILVIHEEPHEVKGRQGLDPNVFTKDEFDDLKDRKGIEFIDKAIATTKDAGYTKIADGKDIYDGNIERGIGSELELFDELGAERPRPGDLKDNSGLRPKYDEEKIRQRVYNIILKVSGPQSSIPSSRNSAFDQTQNAIKSVFNSAIIKSSSGTRSNVPLIDSY